MSGRIALRLLAIPVLLLSTAWSNGQTADYSSPESSSQHPVGIRPVPSPGAPYKARAAFRQLVHAAGTIFSGTVTNIESHAASGSQMETVSITFHVDHAIRGTAPGQTLTISEWIGLWSGGQRYRVGERVALFLYPASRLGLTSSVAGPVGRFEVDAARHILISAQHRLAFRSDPVLSGRSRVTLRELAMAVRDADEKPVARSEGRP